MRAEDILPDNINQRTESGVTVRKGSVAAFMANVRIMQQSRPKDLEYVLAWQHMMELLPGLLALGVFEIFEIRDEGIRGQIERAIQLLGGAHTQQCDERLTGLSA